ncbi:MAG: hypothetical protein KF800_20255 [Lysobacter sp.]|nr:hypothetical protein [Lysobacter sp.]
MYSQNGQIPYEEDHHGTPTTAKENIYLAGSVIATRENRWGVSVEVKYQHTDALGSPVAVTNASGQVIERMDYEPWGAIIGKPNHNGIGYTGHVMDGATGLTYMQQRYYDQSVGRFLSVDPITANGQTGANFNRYKYAANNPYRFIDPDGRLEANTCSRLGAESCSGTYATNAIEAGWSMEKRLAAADKVIRRTESRLEKKENGNRFKNFDEAARYFKSQFAKIGAFLQLEFGASGEPISHSITGITRSGPGDFRGLVGVRVDIGPIPEGGAQFHTHPGIFIKNPSFSGDDLHIAMHSKGVASYVFYGYITNAGKKLDIVSAQDAGVSAYDSKIYNFISNFE